MTDNKQQPVDHRKASRHLLRLAGFALAFSFLLVLFSLLVIGLPEQLTQRINAQVLEAGIPLHFDSVRLSHRGWVLGNARIYSASPDDLKPMLRAKKLYVLAWPAGWKNLSRVNWNFKIYVKNLAVSLGHAWENTLPPAHPFRTVHRFKASLTVSPEFVTVKKAYVQWGEAEIRAHGSVSLSARGKSKHSAGKLRKKDVSLPVFSPVAAETADVLSRLQFEQDPQITLDFNIDSAHPDKTVLNAALSAGGLLWNGHRYDSFSGVLNCLDRQLTLSSLELAQSDGSRLTLCGTSDIADGETTLSATNTLSVQDLLTLLPEKERTALATSKAYPSGRFDFIAQFGPAPVKQLFSKITVDVQAAGIKRLDLTLDPLTFRLIRNGDQLTLNDIQANANGGPLSGNFSLDLGSKAWSAEVQAQCDPGPVGTLTGGGFQKFIERFSFPEEPPKADLTLSRAFPGANLYVAGTLEADHFTCGGVPLGHMETSMVYSNRVVDLTPLHINRGNEKFDGSIQVDLAADLAFFNAVNSFPPEDIIHILALEKQTVLEQFKVHGPISSSGSGRLDFGKGTHHAFSGTFKADSVEFGRIRTGPLSAAVEGKDAQLLFTNIVARLCDGEVEGSAEFSLFRNDGTAPYHITARLTQLDFAQLTQQLSGTESEHSRGLFSATIDLTADAKAGFWNSVYGSGQTEIENGRLADLPVFGGFLWLIKPVFPMFNLFSLTTFFADYKLHDGAVWSDNAQLGGTLFSARGRGHWSPQSGLNFLIRAEPLRQTRENKAWYQIHLWAADALKEGLSPLFRFFEFRLEGSLDNPQWRFVNLPREVSELLQRSKSSPEK
jgi:hypothetical protein